MSTSQAISQLYEMTGYVEGASIPRLAKMQDDLTEMMYPDDRMLADAEFERLERACRAVEVCIDRFERSEINGEGRVPFSVFAI